MHLTLARSSDSFYNFRNLHSQHSFIVCAWSSPDSDPPQHHRGFIDLWRCIRSPKDHHNKKIRFRFDCCCCCFWGGCGGCTGCLRWLWPWLGTWMSCRFTNPLLGFTEKAPCSLKRNSATKTSRSDSWNCMDENRSFSRGLQVWSLPQFLQIS